MNKARINKNVTTHMFRHSKKLIRFIIYLVFFYLLAIFLFTLGTKIGLQYLLASGTTILILFPLRLLILKKVVYKIK